jgi:S-adenosylmethionine:tRNA ribosyltransferase-isomerase
MHFFDYALPERLIAQRPAAERDAARLLVVRRDSSSRVGSPPHGFPPGPPAIEHRVFRDLPELLAPGDLVVLNDTRVLPARLVGRREATGGKWEGLFLRTAESGLWEMLAQTRGYPEVGTAFVADTGLRLVLRGRTDERHWLMQPEAEGTPPDLLARYGHVPLPPYIRKGREEESDRERYQTVYAQAGCSVAAPTAGLHFTPAVFDRLAARGIGTARVTLHVGLGTFAPVKADDPTKHAIHREWCEVRPEAADAIRAAKARGGRVVAVGTTTTRTLETAARAPFTSPGLVPAPVSGASRGAGESEEVGEALRAGWEGGPEVEGTSPPTRRLEDSAATSPSRGGVKSFLPHSASGR